MRTYRRRFEYPANLRQSIPVASTVVFRKLRLQLSVNPVAHRDELIPRLFQPRTRRFIPAAQFLKRHVQLEHFFQQFRRNVLRPLLPDIESILFEQILGPRQRIAQRAIRVVQDRRRIQRHLLLLRALEREPIRMILPAERIEPPFQIFQVEI